MGRNNLVLMMAVVLCATMTAPAHDMFGTGVNQFTIDFVTISGDSGDLGFSPAGSGYMFSGANRSDYRIGAYEITNDQWDKFAASLGVPVTGSPATAYDESPNWTGTDVPTSEMSWYEAAQFVNWLNTSTGHHAAYKFTGTQGTNDYTFAMWSAAEADGGTNFFRHKDAFYFLPTEDEWVKAAYWNGTGLQSYATPDDTLPTEDAEANYEPEYGDRPWDVGSGSEELNGTFDMMGNVWDWLESPYTDYAIGASRTLRGGSYLHAAAYLGSGIRIFWGASVEFDHVGFRVASEVPEPATLSLLALGGVAMLSRRK